jgi:hypothetical protein
MTVELRRKPDEVQEELDYARGEVGHQSSATYDDHLRGVVAGLEWALGHSQTAPVSLKAHTSPDWRAQFMEAQWAGEIETGVRRTPAGMTTHFAGGVMAALLWASGQTENQPS